MLALTAILLVAASGCGTPRGEGKATSTKAGHDSTATASAGVRHGAKSRVTTPAHVDTRPTGATNHVRLTEKGCVDFEPRWASIGVGQSLTWSSDLKQPVTIHVSPGAFDRTEFRVPAHATLSSGPARKPGSFSISTEPAACQGIPRGAQGSGPGVTVTGAAPH